MIEEMGSEWAWAHEQFGEGQSYSEKIAGVWRTVEIADKVTGTWATVGIEDSVTGAFRE